MLKTATSAAHDRARRRLAILALSMVVLSSSAQAHAAGDYGFNRVSAPDRSSAGTGYGSGWVALSGPGVNDPIVGYLFSNDGDAAGAADHMDIFNSASNNKYPRGWAYGQFNGCAYAYTFLNFERVSSSPHSADCVPAYAGMTKAQLFCSDPAQDALCNTYGAYQKTYLADLVAPSANACPAYANLGASAFKGLAQAGTPHNFLGWVGNAGALAVDVRYVTKDGKYVMAKFDSGTFKSYPDLVWAFVPRRCVRMRPDVTGDGRGDLTLVYTDNTGSGRTEAHVLDGATGFGTWVAHVATAANYLRPADQVAMGDVSGDGKADLVLVYTDNTGSGRTEAHVLDGATGFTTWYAHWATAANYLRPADRVVVNDVSGDARADLVLVYTDNTGSGRTETHVLDAATGFTTWFAHWATTANYLRPSDDVVIS